MRVLVVTPECPAPVHVNGGATRQYELYKRLIELGHSVTVVAVMPPHVEDFSAQLRDDGFDLRPVWRRKSRPHEAMSAVLRKPSTLIGLLTDSIDDFIARIFWVDLQPVLRRAVDDGPYDAIVFEHQNCSAWFKWSGITIPSVTVIHEVRSVQFVESAKLRKGLAAAFWRANTRRVLRAERRWTPLFSAAVTMSEREAERVREIVPDAPPIYPIGNGAAIEKFDAVGPDPNENVVLFTGTLNFGPNASAAQWIAREVWPLVRARVPEARLTIVGRDPSEVTAALDALDGVEIHSNVPSMIPWYERASVCTLPMLEGGGTRLKFAESMAAARAVVSTTNGATGIAIEDGREAFIADGREDFADAIVRLLRDPELRAQMATHGRETAVAKYDWRVLGEDLAKVLEAVASGAS